MLTRLTCSLLLVSLLLAPSAFAAGHTKVPTRRDAAFSKRWNRMAFDHALLDGLLRRFVKDGRVDYRGLRAQRRTLDEYLFRIATTDPSQLVSDDERFAFYINAYNAVTLRAVLDRLPADPSAWPSFSVTQVKGFWKLYAYEVGTRFVTLDELEHKILRPVFKRPRVHFAIVCASKGCPALASQAYRASTLSRQLADATRRFFRRRDAFRLERESKTVHLSPLFQWFKSDFRRAPYKHELEFVADFVPADVARFLRKSSGQLKILYLPYDWKLNVR